MARGPQIADNLRLQWLFVLAEGMTQNRFCLNPRTCFCSATRAGFEVSVPIVDSSFMPFKVTVDG